MWMADARRIACDSVDGSLPRSPQNMVVFVHVRRDLVEAGAPLSVILEDVNRLVRDRKAIILANGQFLRQQISPDWNIDTYFDDDTSSPYDHPIRKWDEPQRRYFGSLWGIRNPYQYGENHRPYDQFCIGAAVPEPYLVEDERILALVDAKRDGRHIYCPCHCAEVVHTSRQRVVCMACGQLHCVLARPLDKDFGPGLSGDEWGNAFDLDGELIDDSVALPVVDYREIRASGTIWTTDAWLEATWQIEFYATATPEEIERYEAGLPTPEDFLEAGFTQIPQPPPPASQIREEEFGFDIAENAAAALNAGAVAFVQSRTKPDTLRDAVLNLFQAVELLLKVRLGQIEPALLRSQPNNPTVLKTLQAAKTPISDHDVAAIGELRRLRNQLQHDHATYSYRSTRALLRRILVFVDSFSLKELGWWIGDAITPTAWGEILGLEHIQRNAESQAASRVTELSAQSGYLVQICPNCDRETLVRARRGGSECMYCRNRPTLKELSSDDPRPTGGVD